ncbi:hypothetical protein Pyn_39109 [Prunus yedoensis var. nudiflora]|uniref:Uncharacterized protein n=1 Tax=Prunus yedoensis var. nudiflora TaxID=2094558 RepID=A0A314ZG34_PRUYE|nr:hypothetical protein Pyn_39109 [Prunus yedoensis var. nudiflora]
MKEEHIDVHRCKVNCIHFSLNMKCLTRPGPNLLRHSFCPGFFPSVIQNDNATFVVSKQSSFHFRPKHQAEVRRASAKTTATSSPLPLNATVTGTSKYLMAGFPPNTFLLRLPSGFTIYCPDFGIYHFYHNNFDQSAPSA